MVYLPSLVASVENYDAVTWSNEAFVFVCQVCNMAESNCKRLDLECWPQNLALRPV